MQEQIEFGNNKSESHQSNAGSEPRQEGSLVGQHRAGVGRVLSDVDSSSQIVSLSPDGTHIAKIYHGSAHEQCDHLESHYAPQQISLIYWDPPFFTGRQHEAEQGAFSDAWPDLSTYLDWIRNHIERWRSLLTDDGFLVVHCDWHAGHYIKVIGDMVMGWDNFRNEIVWHYTGRRQPARLRVNAKHDTLFVWAKTDAATFFPIFDPYDRDGYVNMKKQPVHIDEDGREWIWGHRGKGQSHAYRIYIDEAVSRGKAIDTVWDIPIINTTAKERVGYPTQKPVQLLSRLINLCTEPNDWIWDPMAGSGTTLVAAITEGRNVFGGDNNPQALSLMQQRLNDLSASHRQLTF